MTDEVRDRIRGLLVKVGDERKKVVGNVKGLAAIIKEDIAEHRDTILISLIECGKYLPTKSGVYGTWLALMNPDNRVFVAECVASIYSELRYAINDANLEISLCLVRLLIECANAGCVAPVSVVGMLSQLLRSSLAVGAPDGSFGVYLVAGSVPWFSPNLALNDGVVSGLIEEVVSEVTAFVTSSAYQARKGVVAIVSEVPDQLESAIEAIVAMKSSGWESEVLIRPYLMDGIKENLQATAPEFVHSVPVDDSALYESAVGKSFVPQVFVRTESALPVTDRWILEETLSNLLSLFHLSAGECAKALLRVPFLHESFEAVLANVVVSRGISGLGKIPRAFYDSVAHRCLVLQESLVPGFEDCVVLLSNGTMSADREFALAEMLAFVFTNNVKLNRLGDVSQSVVVKMLTFSLRLGFVNSVQGKLQESLHFLLPGEPGQGSPFELSDAYARVKEAVRIKDGSEVEVTDVLLKNEPKSDAFKLFAQAMVETGSRTVSHFARLIELYKNVILRADELGLISAAEKEAVLLTTVIEFWSNNAFRLEKSCEQLVRNALVSPKTIVTMMSVDPESLSTYKLIDIVMRALVASHEEAKKMLAEDSGMQTDELSRNLAQAEHDLTECASALMEKSAESVQRWIVRNFHRSVTGVDSELFKLF